jgi:hypothetical protein
LKIGYQMHMKACPGDSSLPGHVLQELASRVSLYPHHPYWTSPAGMDSILLMMP